MIKLKGKSKLKFMNKHGLMITITRGSKGTTLAWTKHGRLTGQDEARKRV
ncbi:hypothetical protein Hdeb2414_s0018g00538631 [Helianthus debilis subsp. tardiflorus]